MDGEILPPKKRGRGRPKGTTGIPRRSERETALSKHIDIRSVARSFTNVAVTTLCGIMTNKDAPAASRVAAAGEILNRGWGKPTQPIGGDEEAGPIVFRWLTQDDK